MSAADRAVALVTWWVTTYSRHLPAEVAERRQAELASDLWEQRAWGQAVSAPAPAVALSILRRMTAGMPADLRWRHHQLAATRGRPLVPEGRPVLRSLARNWWLILAALVGLFEVAFGVAIPLEEGANFDTIGGGSIIATAGLLVLGGIAVRRRRDLLHPGSGDRPGRGIPRRAGGAGGRCWAPRWCWWAPGSPPAARPEAPI